MALHSIHRPVLSIVILFAVVCAATADERSDRVDKLFSDWDSTHSPGAAIAVIRDGEIIYERGYGMADLEHGVLIGPDSVFRIGSTSKQFTAFCVALLAHEDRISLDESIVSYIPELPEVYRPVTVRHLIHHTSGVRDYLELQALAGVTDYDFYTAEEALELLSRQRALNFPPGGEFLYSNSGYFLLGVIVERVCGKTLAEFARERIFEPLGMVSTHYHDDHTLIVPNRADGYSESGGDGYYIDMTYLEIIGDGAVFTTVRDMALWDRVFYGGFYDDELIETTLTPGALNSGESLDYAFGLGVTDYRGRTMISHGGAFVGFRADMIRFPELRFSVICLANCSSINPSGLCTAIADIYLEEVLEPEEQPESAEPAAEPEFIELPEESLRSRTGIYRRTESGIIRRVIFEDGDLWYVGPGYRLKFAPVSEIRFVAPDDRDVEIIFGPAGENGQNSFRVFVRGAHRSTYLEIEVCMPTTADLEEYVGTYYSEELDATYSAVVEEGKIYFMFRNAPDEHLEPLERDAFWLAGRNITFVRDDSDNISGFRLDFARVRGIEFARTEVE